MTQSPLQVKSTNILLEKNLHVPCQNGSPPAVYKCDFQNLFSAYSVDCRT